jgi:hypothetical protein
MKKFLFCMRVVFAAVLLLTTGVPVSGATERNVQAGEEIDPYGKRVASFYDEPSYFPLYAMIKSENIYLYGVLPHGMVLYQNGYGKYFDWPVLAP